VIRPLLKARVEGTCANEALTHSAGECAMYNFLLKTPKPVKKH